MFKDLLILHKISIYALSRKSSVSYTALNELYRGERTIEQCTGKIIKAIANALNMSMDDLFDKSLWKPIIPPSLYKCFWDSNPKLLNLDNNKSYIISRLLDKGGYEGFMFLNQAYTYEDFKYVGLNSRQLTPKIANFLHINFNIKKEDMAFYKANINWRN